MIPSRSDEGCGLAAFFVRDVWSLLKFKDYDYRYPQDGATQVRKMDLQENKRNAIAFYETAYRGNPRKAVEDYVGDEYIQHNPLVGNGPEAFIEYFERMQNEYPNKDITFVRAIAEGNLVALHTHQTWPNDIEYVTMDFFRFDHNGKIVEHWDALQEIPKETLNGHTMY